LPATRLRIYSHNGSLAGEGVILNGQFTLPKELKTGIYFIRFDNNPVKNKLLITE